MRFLPVFLDTAAGVVIVVGSGEPALGKLRLLRAAGAHVRWFSRDVDVAEAMLTLSGPGRLEISFGDPLNVDLSDAVAVVSAAGDALDAQIAARARRHRIPVNVVDRPELSTFIFPAIVDRGEVVVAIGTGGASPVLARRLRELIEALLPARIGDLAQLIGRHRRRFAAVPQALSPRRFWQDIIAGPIAEAVLAGRSDEAEARLVAAIDGNGARQSSDASRTETVFLVGAGPGDPDLLTLRALHALADADVVFYDELVTAAVLDRARRGAEQVFVGKRRGEAGIGQDEINRRLVAAAIDWSGLADRQTTVVVYMGLATAAAVRDGLIAAGRDGATPAAVLARGTRPDSQAAVGRLEELAALAAEVGEGPAILVIGEVAARSAPWRAAQVDAVTAREAA
jgi:uroporphyrin-III C-methyltransferase/precorrin-2 dehydrogenase/sirohydrochlorin ferrochelatase